MLPLKNNAGSVPPVDITLGNQSNLRTQITERSFKFYCQSLGDISEFFRRRVQKNLPTQQYQSAKRVFTLTERRK